MTGERLQTAWAVVLCCVFSSFAQAQWLTQSIALRPGWNAVFLRVQPAVNDCDTVFAGIPVKGVWAWNRRFEPVRYVQDAAGLVPGQDDWLHYVPPSRSGAAAATTLHALHGGRGYLIELGGVDGFDLVLQGTPVLRRPVWVPQSFNLVGLPIDSGELSSLTSFFEPSDAHRDPRIQRLNAAGHWETATSARGDTLRDGEAVWVYCATPSDYQAPVTLDLEQSNGLHFGRGLVETTLRLRNHTATARSVRLALRASEPPEGVDAPWLAGEVPLSYYRSDRGGSPWAPLEGPLEFVLEPGAERALRLAVRRGAMDRFDPPAGGISRSGVLYASLLEVSDGEGTLYTVPVSSEGLVSYRKVDGQLKGVDPRIGLWVGHVSIDYVSSPGQSLAEPEPPSGREHAPNIPQDGQFEFRLIVHVDENLQARLVQQVTLMFEPGEYGPDPVNAGRKMVTEAGRHVLITDDRLLADYTGGAMRDGHTVGRRMSTPLYAFPPDGGSRRHALVMTGAFPAAPSLYFPDQLQCSWVLDALDPLNPFLHRSHPDHQASGGEYALSRSLTLVLTPESALPSPVMPALGVALGGVYREVLTGLHRAPITVEGQCVLYRVSDIGLLNP